MNTEAFSIMILWNPYQYWLLWVYGQLICIYMACMLTHTWLYFAVILNCIWDQPNTELLLVLSLQSPTDHLVPHNVARILEQAIPLMDHPSESFLATLEEDMMRLIFRHGMTVSSCVSVFECVLYGIVLWTFSFILFKKSKWLT